MTRCSTEPHHWEFRMGPMLLLKSAQSLIPACSLCHLIITAPDSFVKATVHLGNLPLKVTPLFEVVLVGPVCVQLAGAMELVHTVLPQQRLPVSHLPVPLLS